MAQKEAIMILADKIITLRKRFGWSQEELAEKMNVSRQSISKWEGALSVPDLDKIIRLSELFGVSTDFLIKDELGEQDLSFTNGTDEEKGIRVSLDEALSFLSASVRSAKMVALGTVLCILSPILLILLGGISELKNSPISEDMAAGLGITALLVLITIAVIIFIYDGERMKRYQYLLKESFELEYGVSGIVSEKLNAANAGYTLATSIGVGLCILSPVPLFICAFAAKADIVFVIATCVLLTIISIAVCIFIISGTIHSSYTKLLQTEEFTPAKKATNHKKEAVSGAYWCLVTAIYLAWSFYTNDWQFTWLVWPVAGVLFGAITAVISGFTKEK